jgi:hypothetical protein
MSSIIGLLIQDHTYFKAALGKLNGPRMISNPDKIFKELSMRLTAHSHFEESSVYPLLTLNAITRIIAFEAFEEHKQIMVLLKALGQLDSMDSSFKAKINMLNEDVAHHIIEEEIRLLPQLKKNVPMATLNLLGITYQEILDTARYEVVYERRYSQLPL